MKLKMKIPSVLAIALCEVIAASAQAQLAIDWFTLDAGGGTSTGGVYTVSGTIGQPEAAWPVDQNGFPVQSVGGNYTLVGGFWSGVPKNARPELKIEVRNGSLVLSWPGWAAAAMVQSATQLSSGGAGWSNVPGSPTRVGDRFEQVFALPLTPPDPIRYFRMYRP